MKLVYKNKRLKNIKFSLNVDKGFEINPKLDEHNTVTITLYDNSIISSYIIKKVLIKLKNIIKLLKDSSDDEADQNVISQLDNLEFLLLNTYNVYLTKEQIKKLLKDIYVLKQKILSKTRVVNKIR